MTGCWSVDLTPIRDLRAQRRAMIDEDIPAKEATQLVAAGVGADFYPRIRVLAAGTGRDYWLTHAGEGLILEGGLPVEQMFRWLKLFARATAADLSQQVSVLLGGNTPSGEEAPIRRWHAMVGGLAPLAWAAGLTLDEAAVQRAAGTLQVEDLRVLATLRGYRPDEADPVTGNSA